MVEISGSYCSVPFRTSLQVEEKSPASSGAVDSRRKTEEARPSEARLELIRAQNVASPIPERLDLSKAAEIMRQVRERLRLMEKKEARELYQDERLRELTYRIFQFEER